MNEGKVIVGPRYHVHIGTSNKSFVTTSNILAEKGIRNSRFMLALLDKGLADIDPFNENLSDEIRGRILAEIVGNPWYFLREVVRVPVTGGVVPYALHLGNLFLTWCMLSNINAYLVLPRQNYKTVSACAVYMWAYNFGTRNSHMLFFNKELGDSQNNLKRIKDLTDELPQWLVDSVLADPINDRNAIEYIYSAHRNNRIDPKPAGRDPSHADKLGRGNTVPMVWYDEISFAKYIRDTYTAAAPAQSQARESAIQMGKPYGTVITTTPNALSDPSGEFAYMIRNGSLRFRLEFYDYGPTKVRHLIDTQAEFNFVYAEYTYKELGRSEEWFRVQCRELLNDQVKIKRELLLVWPMSTEGSVFTEEQLDVLIKYQRDSIATMPVNIRDTVIPAGMEMEFIEMPNPAKSYILSIDTSGGVGRDYTSFILIDPDTMKAIGLIKTNTADDDAIKAIARYLMVELFPKSVAVIERNYLGIIVINYLLKTGLESRLFYLEKEREAERTVGKMVVRNKRRVKVYGVDTTATSREAMFRYLFQIIDELPHTICLKTLQDEIRTLHRKKTGKIEARSGFHDDVLMSYLIAVYADRHDQPVMRQLLNKNRAGEMAQSMDSVAVLNTGGSAVPSVAAMHSPSKGKELTLDEYEAREAKASLDNSAVGRRRMSDMLSLLNAGGDFPL